MALTQKQVSELYVTLFGRASEGAGNTYWQASTESASAVADLMLESDAGKDYFADSLDSDQSYIEHIYLNTLNKTYDQDVAGVDYWVDRLAAGASRGEIAVEIINAVYTYENSTDLLALAAYNQFVNRVEVSNYTAWNIKGVGLDPNTPSHLDPFIGFNTSTTHDYATVEAIRKDIKIASDTEDNATTETFTLTPVDDVEGESVLMWGYNAIDNNPDVESHGIPVEDLLSFLSNISDVDLFELGLIDDDGVATAYAGDVISNVTIGGVNNDDGMVTITTNDGQVISAEASLGADYMNFLSNLIFDAAGNSRLYTELVGGEEAPDIILTTEQNNGGTVFRHFTSAENETIVAGRTELLHDAYIDADGGYDRLEVDMKGGYAQPLALLNIEEIQVQNLPNVYDANGDYDPDNSRVLNSILDLSRAADIELLVITEGLHTAMNLGSLSVVGIRNGAEVTLEGGFTEDVNIHFGEGLGDAVNLNLNIGDAGQNFTLNIAHNSNTLNINSFNGENAIDNVSFGAGVLSNINISGDAALYIGSNLESSFHDGRTATIDASENTGGVDLNIDGQPDVSFIGSTSDDDFTAAHGDNVAIVDLEGNNTLETGGNTGTVSIVTGAGDDTITSVNDTVVTIDAGDGENTMTVSAEEINVSSGAGDDTLTLAGTAGGQEGVMGNVALITLDLGAGQNTLNMGDSDLLSQGLVAAEGSSITGENIKLVVDADSDLHSASLVGITSVVLDNADVGSADPSADNAMLTLTAAQFSDIDGANFSVEGSTFGTKSVIEIIVEETTSLTDLGVDNLPLSIDLKFVVMDGVTLNMTAEQLHTWVAPAGIIQGQPDVNDIAPGQVVVTDAGLTFDAFDPDGDNDAQGTIGSIGDGFGDTNVKIHTTRDGFERPEDTDTTNTMTIDSDLTPVVEGFGDADTLLDTLVIEGDSDITFDGPINLGDNFSVDFSDLNGSITGLTLAQFDDIFTAGDPAVWGEIIGNGDARVDIQLNDQAQVGYNDIEDGGIHSSGVSTFVVTGFNNEDGTLRSQSSSSNANIFVCDSTQDVEVLGLQNNRHSNVNFENVNWGTEILLEGDGSANASEQAKTFGDPDLSEIGRVNVHFFEEGANAVVNINNQGVELGADADTEDGYTVGGERTLDVAGFSINNADRLIINVTDGDVEIHDVSAPDAEVVVVNAVEDVFMHTGNEYSFTNNEGTVISGFDKFSDDINTLDGSGVVGEFTIQLDGGTFDFSEAALSGIEQVIFNNPSDVNAPTYTSADLTLSVDQILDINVDNFSTTTDGVGSTMDVVGLAEQVIDLNVLHYADIDIVDVYTADVDGTIVLDAATTLGGAEQFIITALTSDTGVQMTADQFHQICGAVDIDTEAVVFVCNTESYYQANLILTDLAYNEKIDLSLVDQAGDDVVNVTVQVADITATINPLDPTDTFTIKSGEATLEVSGTVDLTSAVLYDTIIAVDMAENAILNLTAAQVAEIGFADLNGDGIADVWSGMTGSTLNIVDLDTEVLDLDAVNAAGINIGTVAIADYAYDHTVVIAEGTTFGDADEIVTPTADVNDTVIDGIEPTTVQMTVQQFLTSAGIITGDSQVNLTNLVNNVDVDGAIPYTADVADVDLSGIVNAGILELGDLTVTLADTADLGTFEIQLSNGQMIQFATEGQASGTTVSEVSDAVTAIAWLFDTITAELDTTGYDGDINTLFINELLVDGIVNEEDLWNALNSAIVVEKVNSNEFPDVLVGFDRTNTFEALTAIDGVSYDDQNEFQSVEDLSINLEGNTNIGDVGIGDTVVPIDDGIADVIFDTLTINSYEDRTTLEDDNGFDFQPNKVGDISLNTGSFDELLNVTLSTADNFNDVVNVNGAAALRDGLALEVGTISFAANEDTNEATLTLIGENDITIGGVDISDAEVNMLTIDATANAAPVMGAPEPQLIIGDVAGGADLTDLNMIYVVENYVHPVTDTTTVFGTGTGTPVDANVDLLEVRGGDNDFTDALAANFNIDLVNFSGDGALTLTAAQVIAIGTTDGIDADNIADAWSALAGLDATLNIVELDSVTAPMALDLVAAAGINIGKITIKDTNADVTIDPATNLGDADSIEVPAGTTLNLTALQFDQLEGTGTITSGPLGVTETALGIVNITDLVNTIDSDDLDTTADDYTFLDVTLVTATQGTITLGAADVSVGNINADVHSILGDFTIELDDIDSTMAPNELAGQTIRFSTALQAERAIIVEGEDPAAAWVAGDFERDTNVVWLFDTITGTETAGEIDTHEYDAGLGRVWVNDVLVDGGNVESIFSGGTGSDATTGIINLNATTIVRVVNTADLDTLLPNNLTVSRTLEVEAFTQLPAGLTFDNPDLLVGVSNLTLDLGGAVTMGELSIDNVLAPATVNGDEFGTLTINSLLADTDTHYLLPESWDVNVNPRPDQIDAALQHNTIGDIASGATRDELANVTINATSTGLETGTITFSDDGGLTPLDPADDDATAVLTVTGGNNINIASVDTSDADITAVTVVATDYTGTLTAPGTSPGIQLDNTETLTFDNNGFAAGTITLGSDDLLGAVVNAGVAGDELSSINAAAFGGDLNLGVIAQIDSNDDDTSVPADGIANQDAFTFTSGSGVTTATLGGANGLVPSLDDGSTWNFDYSLATGESKLVLDDTVDFSNDDGDALTDQTLNFVDVPLYIEGDVDLTMVTLDFTGGKIYVSEDQSLTLTVAQVLMLNAETVGIQGSGTVKVVGDATAPYDFGPVLDDLQLATSLGGPLQTVNVDFSGITIDLTTDVGGGFSAILNQAQDDNGDPAGQSVVGSPVSDLLVTNSIAGNTLDGAAGNDILNSNDGANTFNVTSGMDIIYDLSGTENPIDPIDQDVLNVSTGATAYAAVLGEFYATADTVNNGTAVLVGDGDNTIDVSRANNTGNGFTLIGSAVSTYVNEVDDTFFTSSLGDAQSIAEGHGGHGGSTLVGSAMDDTINGGNDEYNGAVDTLTGNDGEDTFVFNVQLSSASTLTLETTTQGIDREEIVITAGNAADQEVTIKYTVNGVVDGLVETLTGVLSSDAEAVAVAIAALLDAKAGISASADAGTVTMSGNDAASIEITDVTFSEDISGAAGDGTDVAQISTLTVAGVPTDGDAYSAIATLVESGGTATDNFGQADFTTEAALATVLDGNFTNDGELASAWVLGSSVVTFTDQDADNGGFTIATDTTAAFGGSGASDIGATDVATLDVITDFNSADDSISFGLDAGTGANYTDDAGTAVDTYATALTNADAAFDGTIQYYATSAEDTGDGVLFFDANLDGNVDGAIELTGVTSADIAAADIIAA